MFAVPPLLKLPAELPRTVSTQLMLASNQVEEVPPRRRGIDGPPDRAQTVDPPAASSALCCAMPACNRARAIPHDRTGDNRVPGPEAVLPPGLVWMPPAASRASTTGRLTAGEGERDYGRRAANKKPPRRVVLAGATQQEDTPVGQSSVQLFLSVGFDGAVGCGIGHAGQHKAGFDLVVVQEALIGLIDGASGDLACTGGASTGAAGIGSMPCSSAASRMYWSSGTSMVLFRPSLSLTRVTL